MSVEQRYETSWHWHALPLWLRVPLFGLLYVVCAALGGELYAQDGFVNFWLPAGLYSAALMTHPRRAWPALIAAGLTANIAFDWWQGLPLFPILAFALVNSFTAVLGVTLLRRIAGPHATLFSLRDFLSFLIFVAFAAPAIGALFGAFAMLRSGFSDGFFAGWSEWFASQAMGTVLFTPFLVTWLAKQPQQPRSRPARVIEAIVLYLGLAVLTVTLLMTYGGVANPYNAWLIPLLLWAGLRFGMRGASTASALFALTAAYLLTRGFADLPIDTAAYEQHLLRWQMYMATSALAALAAAVVLNERERTLDALNEREQRYRLLTEASFEGVCIMRNGIITETNEQLLAMTGFNRDELIGRPGIECVAPECREAVTDALQRGIEEIGEHLHIRADGTRFWAEMRLRASALDGDELLTVAVRDVSARKAAEDEIRELNAELEKRVAARTADLVEANRELEAFSYSVSHDLRAPLRHIAGFTSMLEESAAPLNDEANRQISRIRSAVHRMDATVEGLLTLAHLGRSPMRVQDTDLNKVVAEAREQLMPETHGRNIEWRIEPLPHVAADPALLRLALVNLMHNAIKYTQGRDPALIHVGGSHDANRGEAVLYVRDNGAGFDMRFADKLYGIGQRLHSDNEFEGVGIGLANVQRIIQRHDGRVWAEGRVNEGATFYFSLPVQAR